MKILSLLASATEIVHALGLGEFQVGRSHECAYPPTVQKLPICSSPAIRVDGSSAEIDSLVRQQLSNALSIYTVDARRIAELAPTHILTQTQCRVCAVSLEDVEQALKDQIGAAAHIISLEPYSLVDVWSDIRRIGMTCGVPARAESLICSVDDKMRPVSATTRPKVAALEWLQPLMAAGNWVPELIERAGGIACFGEAGRHSPWLTWQSLLENDPDVIIAMPCGFDLTRTRTEMHWLSDRPEWLQLRAVREGRVYLCDGNQYMNRPGPRLAESFEILREIIHPELSSGAYSELYPPANIASGWEVFTR